MSLLLTLLCGCVHLLAMALDVLCFFILVRLIASRLPHPLLTAFERAGRPLVQRVTARLQGGLDYLGLGRWSEQTLVACALLAATVSSVSLKALTGVMGSL